MKSNNKFEIIAEIAQGNEGDPKLAQLLTAGAMASGAYAVKYQFVSADELATPDYQYYDLLKSLELSTDSWKKISSRTHETTKTTY